MFSAFSNPNANPSSGQSFGFSSTPGQEPQTHNQTQSQTMTAATANPIVNAFAAPNPYTNPSTASAVFSAPAAPSAPSPLSFAASSQPQNNSQPTRSASSAFPSNPIPGAGTSGPSAVGSVFSTINQPGLSSTAPQPFVPSSVSSTSSTNFPSAFANQGTQKPIAPSAFNGQKTSSLVPSNGMHPFNYANSNASATSTRMSGAAQPSFNSGLKKQDSHSAFGFNTQKESSAPASFDSGSQAISSPFIMESDDMADASGLGFTVGDQPRNSANTPAAFGYPTQSQGSFSSFSNGQPSGFSAFTAPSSNGVSPFVTNQASSPSAPAFSTPNGTGISSTAPSTSVFSSQTAAQQNSNAFAAFAPATGTVPPPAASSSNAASAFAKSDQNAFSSVFSSQPAGSMPSTSSLASPANVFSTPVANDRLKNQPVRKSQLRNSFTASDSGWDMEGESTGFVDAWFSQVETCVKEKTGYDLSYLFPVSDKLDPDIAAMKRELQRSDFEQLENRSEDLRDRCGWQGLNALILGYLRYLKDISNDPDSRFEAALAYTGKLASAFNFNEANPLNLAVKRCSTYVTNLALYLDEANRDPEWKQAERAHQQIRRLFLASMSQRNRDSLGKKLTILHLANVIFKIYLKTDQIVMMHNTQNSVRQSIMPNNPLTCAEFPKSERCTYAYYVGRYQFFYGRFLEARNTLQLAYDTAHIKAYPQRRLILVYLVTTNIILGKFPSQRLYELPEAVGFAEVFAGMVYALKLGHFAMFEEYLQRSRDWLMHYTVYYELRNCCQVVLWRSLVKNAHRRALKVKAMEEAHRTQFEGMEHDFKKPKLENVTLEHILEAAQVFNARVQDWPIGNREMTMERVEASLLSLLDLKVLRGYIMRNPNGQHLISSYSSKATLFPSFREIFG